jgi:hypothetical protein
MFFFLGFSLYLFFFLSLFTVGCCCCYRMLLSMWQFTMVVAQWRNVWKDGEKQGEKLLH